MTTLRKAREEGKLEEFVAEHEADAKPGNEAAFNRAVTSMAQTSKAIPASSSKAFRDG